MTDQERAAIAEIRRLAATGGVHWPTVAARIVDIIDADLGAIDPNQESLL
jgi:hypothetical protein